MLYPMEFLLQSIGNEGALSFEEKNITCVRKSIPEMIMKGSTAS